MTRLCPGWSATCCTLPKKKIERLSQMRQAKA